MGITTVIVSGIVTDQCVASTVRGLADEGLQVITVEDACAAPDMNLHNAELTIMNVIYTYVMSTNDTLDLLDETLRTVKEVESENLVEAYNNYK